MKIPCPHCSIPIDEDRMFCSYCNQPVKLELKEEEEKEEWERNLGFD